jgi:Glyoxalase/Bleomycin resistance protein/Dioxygenase superfamily
MPSMKSAYGMVVASLFAAICFAQVGTKQTKGGTASSDIRRPAIVGVAHIALKTDNLDSARKFYTAVLGLQEPFSYSEEGHLLLTYFKVNDHQYIEVFPSLKDPKEDRCTASVLARRFLRRAFRSASSM